MARVQCKKCGWIYNNLNSNGNALETKCPNCGHIPEKKSRLICFRIPEPLLDEFDAVVVHNGNYESRAEAIRDAIHQLLLLERLGDVEADLWESEVKCKVVN